MGSDLLAGGWLFGAGPAFHFSGNRQGGEKKTGQADKYRKFQFSSAELWLADWLMVMIGEYKLSNKN